MPAAPSEPRYGEVLWALRESLEVTAGRLYTMDETGAYRLAAFFGFQREAPEEVLATWDPLIDWVQRHRQPAYANSPREAGPMGEVMRREQFARVLTAPVYVGSRMAGILELRDKAGGALFVHEDLRSVQSSVSRLESILRKDSKVVEAPEPIHRDDAEHVFFQPSELSPVPFPPPPPLFHWGGEPQPAVSMRGFDQPVGSRPKPAPRDVLLFKGFVHTLLQNPDIEAVVFSLWDTRRAELYVGSRRPFSEAGRSLLLRHLESARASLVPHLQPPREKLFNTEYPLGRGAGEIGSFAGVQTSVIESTGNLLLFTLVFAQQPVAGAGDLLRETHRLVRSVLAEVPSVPRYRAAYRSLVHAYVERALAHYPKLKSHSLAVGLLSRRFATVLKLPSSSIEQVTVAGLLHDIGMVHVELPPERLFERSPLTSEEMAMVRKHSTLGETALESVEFPYAVAPLVRHHHERYDGTGYPDRLSAERIPLGSRLIGIAEAFDAMTSLDSYRVPIPRESALDQIFLEAGKQFDPELAARFREMILSGAGEESPEAGKG